MALGVSEHWRRLRTYTLYKDDWAFVSSVRTPQRWGRNVWQFHAQHCVPVFRTITALLCWASPDLPRLADLLRLGPVVAFALASWAVAWLAYLLCGSRAAAFGAAATFALSSVHASVVQWYSASVAAWASAFVLLSLGAWLRFVQRGSLRHYALAAVVSALALGCWSISILLPALLAASLLGSWCVWALRSSRRRALMSLGTAVVLSVGWFAWLKHLRAGGAVVTDFEGRPLWEAVHPVSAFIFTCRAVAEVLIAGNVGLYAAALPAATGFAYGIGSLVLVIWAWRRWRLATAAICAGIACVLLGFAFPYAVRASVGYRQLRAFDWYACLPQAGVALLAAAIVERLERLTAGTRVRRTLAPWLIAAVVLAWLTHGSIVERLSTTLSFPDQRAQLAELQAIEDLCQSRRIAEPLLRRVMPRYKLRGAAQFDGLELLELPQAGTAYDVDQVRRWVERLLEYGSATPR